MRNERTLDITFELISDLQLDYEKTKRTTDRLCEFSAWIVEIYLTPCRELCLMINSADRLRAALTNSPKSEKSQIENRSSHAYSNNQFQS